MRISFVIRTRIMSTLTPQLGGASDAWQSRSAIRKEHPDVDHRDA
jgi:hypothetical protein